MHSPIASDASHEDGHPSEFRIRIPNAHGEHEIDWPSVLDALPNTLGIYDSSLRLRYLNRAGRERFGRGLDEIIGRRDPDLLGPDVTSTYWPLLEEASQTLQETMSPRPVVLPGRAGAEELLCSVSYIPIRDRTGDVVAFVGITNSLFVERPPQEERCFKALAAIPSCAITTLSVDGSILSWNPACEALFGYLEAEAVGQAIGDLLADEDHGLAGLSPSSEASAPVDFTARLRDKRGRLLDVFVAASPIRATNGEVIAVAAIIRDVSLTREMRHRINTVKQAEAMAKVAAGLAHDINSAFAIVRIYSQFVAEMALTSEQQLDMGVALDAASRGAVLTDHLLGLYGRRKPRATIVEVGEVVRGVSDLVGRMLDSTITLTTRLHASPLQVTASPQQLDRVLLNLVLNARDAMPKGGVLMVSAGEALVEPGHELHGEIRDGSYAVITVKDTGVGMDSSTAARVFEPSFTTKPEGQGSGLGLAVVQEVVRDLRGFVRVETEKNWGTAMSVYLPLVEGSNTVAALEPSGDQPSEDTAIALTNRARPGPLRPSVLVVDEDSALCQSLVNLLAQNGIDSTAARTAPGALQIMRTKAVDVVVTEQFLSGMDGTQLLEIVHERFPETASVLFTGHASPDIVVAAVNRGRVVKILLKSMQPLAICDEIVRVALETVRYRLLRQGHAAG